jgi:hypothetical protein
VVVLRSSVTALAKPALPSNFKLRHHVTLTGQPGKPACPCFLAMDEIADFQFSLLSLDL